MPEKLFDVIVIGAGPTGENVADRAVKGGLTAAIVESKLVGGECSYYACIPSKVLLRSSAALNAARRVDGAKQAITGQLDASAVLARRTRFTDSWKDDGQVEWLKNAKVDLAARLWADGGRKNGGCGRWRWLASHVSRRVKRLSSAPAPLRCFRPSPAWLEAAPWTNREATRTDRVPPAPGRVGRRPGGLRTGQAFRSLGTKEVTLLDRGDRLLERLEPFVSDKIAAKFRDLGISVHTAANVTRVQRRVSRWSSADLVRWRDHRSR